MPAFDGERGALIDFLVGFLLVPMHPQQISVAPRDDGGCACTLECDEAEPAGPVFQRDVLERLPIVEFRGLVPAAELIYEPTEADGEPQHG